MTGTEKTGTRNKVIAITGASSGIGRATALALAARGATVILGARRSDRVEQLAGEIREHGHRAVALATDVRRRDDLIRMVDTAVTEFGQLDVLVNNAGIGPVFRRQGYGHLVTVASTAAYRTVPGQAVYSATKTAVRTVCEGLRQEVGDTIRVTVVSPGFVHTDFVNAVADPDARATLLASRDAMALDPAAIADAIAYAVTQPDQVDVNEIVVRPTAQR